MRPANHRGLADAGMPQQDFLDLARIDVAAAGNDQVLGPVLEGEEPVGVETTVVAGMQPSTAQRIAARRLVPPITPHNHVAAADDLTGLADGEAPILTVDHADLDVGARHARRAEPLEPPRMR